MQRPTLALAAAALVLPCAAMAQTETKWPTKTVNWVVLFPPGGAMDVIARTLGDRVVVNAARNADKSVKDVLAHARRDPGKLTWLRRPIIKERPCC